MTATDPTSGVGYSFGEVLPSAHMTTIATQLPDLIDGDGGGSYAPSAVINIAGAGLNNVTLASGATLSGGAATISSDVTQSGDVTLSGDTTMTGAMTLSGTASGIRFRVDRTTLVGTADSTLTVENDIYIAASTPTAARTVTLKSTSPAPAEGSVIWVSSTQTGGVSYFAFEREDNTEICRLGNNNRGTVGFVFTNSKWVVFSNGEDAAITSHTA